jgi:enoyl-CoA hydratase/carnithine racemase
MSTDELLVEQNGAVLSVTLNRPRKYNAIHLDMWHGLVAATELFATRDDLRVLLLRAEGPYFCAGIDLHSKLTPPPGITSPAAFRRWYRAGTGSLHPIGDAWEAIDKPVVVAHHGPCLGGALELSLCADFRLAASGARYGLPEIALGGIPGSGGTSRLTRLVGPHWARWLILANQQIDAQQALAMGLVHEVTDQPQFAARVTEFCTALAQLPPEAFAAGKLAIELAADLDRAQARNVERLAVSGLVVGEEYRRLMQAMQDRLARKTQ